MTKRALALVGILSLFACQESVEFRAPLPDEAEPAMKEASELLHPSILPAHKLPWEDKVPGKADAASDYRAAHPQWFAITEGPSGNVRPMKEWEPMQAMLMTYTNSIQYDEPVAQTLVDTAVGALDAGEVWIIYKTAAAKTNFIARLAGEGISAGKIASLVKWYNMDNDSIWHIDYGPFPLIHEDDHTLAFADFKYYYQRYRDDAIPTRLGNILGINTYRSPFDFEGGNFQADGEEFCYFGQRVYQYTGMSFSQVEDLMQEYYGCKKAVVLKDITDDGTGHIDMLFKLCGKHCAIVGEYTVVNDPVNKARMDDNADKLEALVYSDGSPGITVWRLPFPHKYQNTPRTYLNSTMYSSADGGYKVNLWPMYTVDKDLEAEALQVWEDAMPGWDHVGIVSDKISLYSGAVHCVTRTIPAMPFAKWVPDGQCIGGVCQGEEGAYSGMCVPGTEPVPGCWGPEWKCLCNDCSSPSCQIPAGCGNGQCSGSEGCYNCPQDCGCSGGATCNMFSGDCVIGVCGDGECEEGESCSSCEQDCGCGPDQYCVVGVCADDPCGGISFEGCCDGQVLLYCENNQLMSIDCSGNQDCGWNASAGYYDCGTGGAADPSGDNPMDCVECEPDCGGKACGSDGCGGSCGQCSDDQSCNASGQCTDCVPDCDGVQCGDDGCGGSCGVCDVGCMCEAGQCLGCDCVPQCQGVDCGDDGCGGTCGICDEGDYCVQGQCECEPQCEGKDCGDDGCGGTCGQCPNDCTGKEHDPHLCNDGVCAVTCCPDCEGKECGDDGCGGICGECEHGQGCVESSCVPVTCEGACGGQTSFGCYCDEDCPAYDDCCADICDECPELSHCGPCVPDCDGKECGDDGCDGQCGECGEGFVCTVQDVCVESSVPQPPEDVVADAPGAEDVVAEEDTGGTGGGGGGGSDCSTNGRANPAGSLLLLGLMLGLAFIRRASSLAVSS